MPMLCSACGRPMFETNGCLPRAGLLTRTDERDWLIMQYPDWIEVDLPDRCPQCEAARTGYHHLGCPIACCTIHRDDRIGCGCDD